jgi:hypothetical protein
VKFSPIGDPANPNAGQNAVIDGVRFTMFNVSNSVGIDADVVLDDTTIDVSFASGGTASGNVGIDLNDGASSRLGLRNRIRITTRLHTGARWPASDTVIEMPSSFSDTNDIKVNGVQLTNTAWGMLPTSDPGVDGQLWRSGDNLRISAGL